MTYARASRAFSLLEVLIATLILGIGLIMVAAIFPVGAKWSQQGAEETIAQNLALNAVSIIKTKYAPNTTTGTPSGFSPAAPTPFPTDSQDAYYSAGSWKVGGGTPLPAAPSQRVFCLPNFQTLVPVSERTYAVGTGQPFPVPSPAPPAINRCVDAQYFWTALMKVPNDNSTTITLYILVCRRGDRAQSFSKTVPTTPAGLVKMLHCRNEGANAESLTYNAGLDNIFTPLVAHAPYNAGLISNAVIANAFPAVGTQGIGLNSGTVFRQQLNNNSTDPNYLREAAPSPLLTRVGGTYEPVISAVPPDGWPDSPLIYIYQTQLSF